MSMRKLIATATLCMATVSSTSWAANALLAPMIGISDDARSLVVTVPAGCLASMKLELAYDNAVAAASMYIRGDAADRSAWSSARTLSESVPAAGATYTVALADLGVSADASFRLFASNTDIELLDYVEQNDPDSGHDTGIPDNICHAIEFGQYSKPWSGPDPKYPAIIGTRQPNASAGFAIMHNGTAGGGFFMQRVGNQYTYSNSFTVNSSSMNTYAFANKMFYLNGSAYGATAGAKRWEVPLGTTGMNMCMGRFPEQEPTMQYQSRWYYLKLYGSDNAALLDYVPAKRKSDGVAGFYDRAAVKFVTPSDGGAFTGGAVTNDAFVIAATAVSGVCSFPRLARVPAVTTLDTSNGATLAIEVRAGYGTGSKLYLAHDTSDKGDDIADWTGKLEICSSIPAVGGTYTVDLAAQGLDAGRIFRVFIADRYTLLERVQQDSDDDAIDTGIADTLCGGLELGYCSTGYSSTGASAMYASFIGTAFGISAADCGYRVCLAGTTARTVFTQWVNNKYTYRYINFATDACNALKMENNAVTLNGGAVGNPESGNPAWRTSPLGLSRRTTFLGRLPTDAATGASCYGWWYYLKLKGLDGNLLLDYVPVKKPDGTAGFLDRVSARFVTPADGTLAAGDALGDEAYFCAPLSASMTCDDRIPVTATWIGGASGVLGDPANWVCTNFLGAALPDTTLPVAGVTDVTIGGNVSFDCATASDRLWRNAKFLDCTLADDCDWRGFGGGFVLDGTIDLAGNALALGGVPSGGTIASSATGDPAALHIEIPQGVTNENVDCAFSGNLRLFKEGAGMLVATKYPQTYSGGTDIVAGTLKAGIPGDINRVKQGSFFGASNLTLDVRPDGTLDSGGTYYWGHHTINLHGGTLTTSVQPAKFFFNPNIYLTADSRIEVVCSCDCQTPVLDLGGHTLDIVFHNDAWMIFNSLATNGKIVATGNGVANFYREDKDGELDCSTVAFDISEGIQFLVACSNIAVGDLTIRTSNVTYTSGSNVVMVNGRFTPVTQYFPKVQLQAGATLDLSGREGTWTVESLTSGGVLSFAADATVTVAVGNRTAVPKRLVSWTTAPAGADTLNVLCDRSDIKLEVRDDGIYRKRSLSIIVR